jgi:tripartite-type tricarboxylate transporter receptor subunit TctC
MSRSLAPILAAALFALAMPAQAQRVVRIVVPFGTGAVQDTIARAIHNELGQALGASVIVENRAGAGGSIGAGAVAKAAPDGNTLVLAAASHHIVGHLYKKLDYAPLKDFVGVGYIGNSGYAIVAPANLNAGNTREFIAAIKAKPGAYNYASAGNGSATHLGMASFAAMAGLSMQHIPMKSTGDAVNEVLAGRVQAVTSSLIGVMGYKDDPRVKFIAYTGKERSRFLPDLPTAAESGLPGYAFDSWIGLLAPAALPRAEVDKINAALQKTLAEPVVQERLARLGVETKPMAVDDFQKLLRADWETAGVIVKASGATVE